MKVSKYKKGQIRCHVYVPGSLPTSDVQIDEHNRPDELFLLESKEYLQLQALYQELDHQFLLGWN